MQAATHDDAVVVGAGVVGLAISWRLAQAGLRVALVDRAPGAGASRVAAGMLAPVSEAGYGELPLLNLSLESVRRYPAFVEELESVTGHAVGYQRCGTVLVARDADDHAVLDERLAYRHELGLEAERLTSHECRALEPGLSPRVRSGILVAGDHQVDSRALVAALLAACERSGRVRLVREHCARIGTARDGAADLNGRVRGRADGVVLESGTALSAGQVVLAAGCWSGTVGGLPDAARPRVRPVKGQVLILRGPATTPVVARIVRGLDVYLVPRQDGRLIVGGTVEERGFDVRPTAGALHGLLQAAWELVPGIDELELAEVAVGLRPGSPDNAPLLGRGEVDGLVIATGHYRNGIALTPVTADTIAELVISGRTPELLGAFSPARFQAPAMAAAEA